MRFLSRFFDSNDREISRVQPVVDRTNELEPEYEALSDAEIRERVDIIRADLADAATPDEPSDDELTAPDLERRRDLTKARRKRENERLQKALDDVLPEVFAAAREASRRTLGMRHFDVQLMGGIVLHQGRIAEMKTGEGKTLVPTLAVTLNGLTGRGAHLITVNDYLARRDAQWMGPVYHFLGLSLGVITHDTSYLFEPGYPTTDERLINLRPVTRTEAYAADITYGTNNEFGFDYLRDNMVDQLEGRVQRERAYAIVDEVDNILIDEARTPLIISGQAEESADLYFSFARLVPASRTAPRATRRAATTLSTSRTRPSRRPRRGSTRSSSCWASRTCTTRTRGSPATSTPRSGPTHSTSGTGTTSSTTGRSSLSTSSPVARCRAAAGARAFTRRSRRRRVCASSASPRPWPRSPSRTTSASMTSSPA